MGKIELLCLGTGTAESAVYQGTPATSFLVLLDGYPVLQIGAGPGSVRQCMRLTQQVPECILLLDSSMEQTGELGALLVNETSIGRRLRVFASQSVCESVKALLSCQLDGRQFAADMVTFVQLPVARGDEHDQLYGIVHDLSLLLHQHETPSGFVTNGALLCYKDTAIVGLTGAIPFDGVLYSKLAQATYIAAWAKSGEASEVAASIADVANFESRMNAGRSREEAAVFLIAGYGGVGDAPAASGHMIVLQQDSPIVLLAGEFVTSPFNHLQLPLPNVRRFNPPKLPQAGVIPNISAIQQSHLPGSNNTSIQAAVGGLAESPHRDSRPVKPAHSVYSRGIPPIEKGFTQPGPDDARKVYLFTNEDKGKPGKLFMLSHCRTLEQLRTKVADILSIRPLKELVYVTGEKVQSLEEIPSNAELIAIKRAGAPYDVRDLPRLLKSIKRRSAV